MSIAFVSIDSGITTFDYFQCSVLRKLLHIFIVKLIAPSALLTAFVYVSTFYLSFLYNYNTQGACYIGFNLYVLHISIIKSNSALIQSR